MLLFHDCKLHGFCSEYANIEMNHNFVFQKFRLGQNILRVWKFPEFRQWLGFWLHFSVVKMSLELGVFFYFHFACVLCEKMKTKPLIMKRSKGWCTLDGNVREFTIEEGSR